MTTLPPVPESRLRVVKRDFLLAEEVPLPGGDCGASSSSADNLLTKAAASLPLTAFLNWEASTSYRRCFSV